MAAPQPTEQLAIERLLEAFADHAVFMLDPSGRLTTWNKGAQRLAGYSPSDILGQNFERFFTEEDRAAGLPAQALEKAARDGRFESEGWHVRKDGSRFWASVVIDPVRADNGALTGFASLTRDISERHEAQLRLDETREQLFQVQKMEAVGQLAGGIAHDFNNLLTIIGLGTEMMAKLVGDNEKLNRAVDNMRQAVTRGESLTNRLLAFSRRQPLQPQWIELGRELQSVSDLLTQSLRGDISIQRHFPDILGEVEVDPQQFELAVLNVGLNARDALPNGGTIRISGRRVADPGLEVGAAGQFLAVEIVDTGVGMAEEVRARAVEPFFTTKEGAGSGLGLSQAFGFAKQSGGSLVIKSKPGEGTVVTLYLPLATARPAPSHRKPASSDQEHTPAGTTILVVEDDAGVADLAADLLGDTGYTIRTASNAQSALNILRGGVKVDLVFSDIMMPGGMSGVELAGIIKREFPGIFVLLATGYAQAAADAVKEFALVTKPYRREQLLDHIGRILGESRPG